MSQTQTIKQLMQTNRPTLVVPVVNGQVQQDYYQQVLNVFYPRGTQKGTNPVLSSIIKRDNTTQTSPLED